MKAKSFRMISVKFRDMVGPAEFDMTQDFIDSGAWGLLASLDLYDCDTYTVRSENHIRAFTAELCRAIDMHTFGPCQVVHFGGTTKVSGFSMTQMIDTSLVSGHFVNSTNDAYIDVFSCKWFDARVAERVARRWFDPKHVATHTRPRGVLHDKIHTDGQQRRDAADLDKGCGTGPSRTYRGYVGGLR